MGSLGTKTENWVSRLWKPKTIEKKQKYKKKFEGR